MANWHGFARSNYFKVSDEIEFLSWINKIPGLGYWRSDDCFAIYSDDGDSGGWPNQRWASEEEGELEEIELHKELAKYLAKGEIAVLMEAGAEKLHYISGFAIAVDSDGKTVTVFLDDIYELARKELGGEPTMASY